VVTVCDKSTKTKKYWVHIADPWTPYERLQMYFYILYGNDVFKIFTKREKKS